MINSEKVRSLKEHLIEFAEECVADGVKIKSARFAYNVNDRCTQVLLSYEEEDPDYPEPLKMSEL